MSHLFCDASFYTFVKTEVQIKCLKSKFLDFGWQFPSTLILGGDICFWAKNYLEKVLEYHFWGRTFHFLIPTDTGLMIIKLAFCEEHSILIVISTECLIYFVTPVFTLLSRLKSKSNVLNPNIWTLVDNKVTKSSNSTLSPNKL